MGDFFVLFIFEGEKKRRAHIEAAILSFHFSSITFITAFLDQKWSQYNILSIELRIKSEKEFLELTFKEPHKRKRFLWWKKVLEVGKHFVEVTPALKKLWNKKATLLFWLLRRITRTQAPLFTCCGIFHMDILGNSTPLILLWKWQRALRDLFPCFFSRN